MIKTADVEWAQEVCPACESAWQDGACPTCGLTREDVELLLADARRAYADAHAAALEGRIADALAALAEARRLGLQHDTADRLEAICAAVEGREPRSPWLLPFRWRETLRAGEAPGLYLAAREAASGGDWDTALALLEGCLAATPWLRPAHQLKALALCSLGRHDEAVAVCDTFLKELPGDPDVQRLRKAIAGESSPKLQATTTSKPFPPEPAPLTQPFPLNSATPIAPAPPAETLTLSPAPIPEPVAIKPAPIAKPETAREVIPSRDSLAKEPAEPSKPRVRKEHRLPARRGRRTGRLIGATLVCGLIGGYLLGHGMNVPAPNSASTGPAGGTQTVPATATPQPDTATTHAPVAAAATDTSAVPLLSAPLAKEAEEARQEAAETVAQRWLNEAVSEQKSGSPRRAEELADAAAALGKGSYLEDSAILLAAQMAERRKQPDAAQRFASLVGRVPKSDYAGFALHRAAKAALALGRPDEAQGYITTLLTNYPDSRWAKRYRDGGPTPARSSLSPPEGKGSRIKTTTETISSALPFGTSRHKGVPSVPDWKGVEPKRDGIGPKP